MPLTDAHRRQLSQFALIADGYLRLATDCAQIPDTFGMTKAAFLPSATLTDDVRRLAMLSAHLSSAAIRLASIDEVLKWAGFSRATYHECRDYFGRNPSTTIADTRGESCSEWLHIMLRDNAAHEEPPLTHPGLEQQRRRKRQDCIEMLTFADVHSRLSMIATELREHLRVNHSLVVPRM